MRHRAPRHGAGAGARRAERNLCYAGETARLPMGAPGERSKCTNIVRLPERCGGYDRVAAEADCTVRWVERLAAREFEGSSSAG